MPHVCGDEPGIRRTGVQKHNVCPTYVGMNRRIYDLELELESMPHVCGDEPRLVGRAERGQLYAPRMWG